MRGVRPGVQEVTDDGGVGDIHEWGVALLVTGIRVGPCRQQQLHDIGILFASPRFAADTGVEQGGDGLLIKALKGAVDIKPFVQALPNSGGVGMIDGANETPREGGFFLRASGGFRIQHV